MFLAAIVAEIVFYILVVGLVQTIGSAVVALVYFPVAHHAARIPMKRIFTSYLLFNVCLLAWGCLGNLVFFLVAYDRWYVSVDRLVDWTPFFPFGQWVLDQTLYPGGPAGHLIGITKLWPLQALWAVLAAAVWWLALWSTRRILTLRRRHQQSLATQIAT